MQPASWRSSQPVVQYSSRQRGPQRTSPRTAYPTTSPTASPRSSATRNASEMAETRRGCVTTIAHEHASPFEMASSSKY